LKRKTSNKRRRKELSTSSRKEKVADNNRVAVIMAGNSMVRDNKVVAVSIGKVGAVGLSTADPAQLSAGERRLIGLARAVAGAPPLCLMDDPSGALGPAEAGAVLSALHSTAENWAAVICTSAVVAFVAAATRAGARRVRLDSGRVQPGAGAITVVSGWRGSESGSARGASAFAVAPDPEQELDRNEEARP
jgi:ABC-type ATPase involved in cell division